MPRRKCTNPEERSQSSSQSKPTTYEFLGHIVTAEEYFEIGKNLDAYFSLLREWKERDERNAQQAQKPETE